MDREILVTDRISHEMIDAGRRLLNKVESTPNVESVVRVVDAAFWLRETEQESSRWSLVIAAPGISFEGPRKGYIWVHQALDAISSSSADAVVPNDMVAVMDTNSELIEALRASFGRTVVRDRHLQGATLGRRYFEELYIYRVDPVRTITCSFSELNEMNDAQSENHVYVFLEQKDPDPFFGIVAHGRLRINDDVTVTIDLPTKYKIESGDDVECRVFLPIDGDSSIRRVILERKQH